MPLKLISSNPSPRSPAPRIPRTSYMREHCKPGHEDRMTWSRLAWSIAMSVAIIGLLVLAAWLDTMPGVR